MFSRLRNRGLLSGVVLGLAACSSQAGAPSEANACLRMFEVANQKPRFEIITRDVPNLESCAALLEGARMMEGRPTSGACNGHFIFATEDQITSARALDGTRIRIFEAKDRQKIQDGLRVLIEHRRAQASLTN